MVDTSMTPLSTDIGDEHSLLAHQIEISVVLTM